MMRCLLTARGERAARIAAARALLEEVRREAYAERTAAEREAVLARPQAFARTTRSGFDLGIAP